MTTNPPDRRAEISAKLWEIAKQTITAEWICCQPVNPDHRPCTQGDVALSMVKVLLVDSPEAWNPAAPLLDAVMGLLPSERRADIYHEIADRLMEDAETGNKEGFTRIYRRAAAKKVRQWANEEHPVSPAYARLQAAAKEAAEAAHLHAMHGMKAVFQLAHRYGTDGLIPAAEVLNALGLDENANTVESGSTDRAEYTRAVTHIESSGPQPERTSDG